jgi:polyhydroxyalkanoate synthesis regulator phasin
MDQMEMMTQGWWRPSPGSVYPLLDELVKEGSIRKREDGRYKLNEIPQRESGWPFGSGPPFVSGPRTVPEVLTEISGLVAYLEDLKQSQPTALATQRTELRAVRERLEKLEQ